MVHIKEPLLLIGKSSSCGGSGFPLSLFEWSFTICLTPYNRKYNVMSVSLNKTLPPHQAISLSFAQVLSSRRDTVATPRMSNKCQPSPNEHTATHTRAITCRQPVQDSRMPAEFSRYPSTCGAGVLTCWA